MMRAFLITNLILISQAYAVTQEPERCLQKQKAPCLVETQDDASVRAVAHIKLHLSANAIIRINQFPSDKSKNFSLDVLSGQLIVENKQDIAFSINSVGVGHQDTYYIKKEVPFVSVYKAQAVDFLKISQASDLDSIESKNISNQKVVSEYIAQFNNAPAGLSQIAMEKYEAHVPQRKVANEDTKDAEARQIKKIKETFFMRTFER